jgi:hypothetical protein
MKRITLYELILLVLIICHYSCKTRNSYEVIIPQNIIEKSDSISNIVLNYFQEKNDSFQINTAKFILDRLKYNMSVGNQA